MHEYIRSDNGQGFTTTAVKKWLAKMGVMVLFIQPGSPWENAYSESFNVKLRGQRLIGEIRSTLVEAIAMLEAWHWHSTHERPHNALGYRSPDRETVILKLNSVSGDALAGFRTLI